ncbi:stage II sporulation protein R [Desulfosporosinus sp. PR]|uniref:stage II sporulation protein R n=1 Tax=Candidatus Desulfosporosinus nitrosoreducens TaxID=3401928 RepID=UPI0027FDDABA|nr:stage II sporulation protein R [Desulfosporosinus sp. PR]MDQ7092748.1 stage II sporulation protein R [Desulfosporosinus sp. PR]
MSIRIENLFEKKRTKKVVYILLLICMAIVLLARLDGGLVWNEIEPKQNTAPAKTASTEKAETLLPDQLIRFHVLANSDSDQDQALKRAVRDAILKEVSPKLAASHSLEESRQILQSLRFDMEDIGRTVVKAWGKDYPVHTEYGHFSFPTKSYGTLILPAGDYEALRVVIGEGKGSNWWCVLFPPLCFIDIEHSTAVQVDGKPGIPINDAAPTYPVLKKAEESGESIEIKGSANTVEAETDNLKANSPKVRFYFWDLVSKLLH